MNIIKYTILAALAALAPIQSIIISVGILIISDLITGVIAAHKRGEKITSAALRRTISKMFIYQLVVITGYLLEVYLIQGIIPVTKLIAGIIGLVEFTSILENANAYFGKNIFKEVLSKLGSQNDKQIK